MKIDFLRHLLFGVIITAVHIVLSWVCLGRFVIVWIALTPPILIGGAYYGLKDVKGFIPGILSGFIYVSVGSAMYMLTVPMFSGGFMGFFDAIPIFGAISFGLVLLAGIFGWVNGERENEIRLNEAIDPYHE